MYIWDDPQWPQLTWRSDGLMEKLSDVRHAQGRLLGRMEGLGFRLREEAMLQTLTQDVVKSSEIEGEHLDIEQVRSSIARRLGLDIAGLVPADRNVDGVVEMMLDATQNFDQALTTERLFAWHAALFPTGYSGLVKIKVAGWRDDSDGPMRVVSGPIGRERIHYVAPPADKVAFEMERFVTWFNAPPKTDPVLKSAQAHFWFVTIHPFEDGNGRMARAIADMALARSEKSRQRFYSMSNQIRQERKAYYEILERSQKSSVDITAWMDWFLGCLGRAVANADTSLTGIMLKAKFWERFGRIALNNRQIKVLNRLLDGFDGKLTTSKWAIIAKCSQDTATRDIQDLIAKGALRKNDAGGRSTSYELTDGDETHRK
ncbi:Fic family protein [Dongia sp.]|uniref:Fic family protein n=1 Tax=Dongia sp. TaxID=1977262 RepID=UPI0035B421CE